MAARARRNTDFKAPSKPHAAQADTANSSRTATNPADDASVDAWHEPSTKEKLQMIACILLIVAAIFAITAMEAPFYLDYNRAANEPMHPGDSHIGAPWRYWGISVLWYISVGSLVVGITTLVRSRQRK